MKHIYSFLIMLMFCQFASAVELANASYHDFITIPYVSVDAENNPVVLSAYICYPTNSTKDLTPRKVNFVVLNNHGTITNNEQAPTGSTPLDAIPLLAPRGAMNLMTSEGALVISCDYLGYGYSKDRVHPYCNHTLTARNVIDGFIAAMDTVRARGIEIDENYYTYNVGYSQGGSVTMAVQKYLETEASQEVKDIFRLKRSIAGAGPYNLEYIFHDLCEQESLAYACSLPLTLEALYTAYKEGCMKQVDLDKIYITPEFHQQVSEILRKKEMDTSELSKWIENYFGKSSVNLNDLFKAEGLVGNSAEARALLKALKKCNMLDGSWTPETPILLYHYSKDEVVQFGTSTQAAELFGDKVKLITEADKINFKSDDIATLLPVFMSNPKTHSDYGIYFYAYVVDGIFRDMADELK